MEKNRFLHNNTCCPVCRSPLEFKDGLTGNKRVKETEKVLTESSSKSEDPEFKCQNPKCANSFPIINGIPILINESKSVFTVDDYIKNRETTFHNKSKTKKRLNNLIPQNSENLKARENLDIFKDLLLKNSEKPKVLVIGGSILGNGMENLSSDPAIELIESDVSFGPRTQIIMDAHDIPFDDKSFDGVVVQAVLEHVVDPYKCVKEIHRVLKDNGLVYAETPFMQQIHMGRYDFTRFTHLGHRRLFRDFDEISSGATGGSAMALAWSYQYFLLSFAESGSSRDFLKGFARITSFWLKYLDKFLINKPGAMDAAFGYYFLGMKSKNTLSDRKLIQLYQGNDI